MADTSVLVTGASRGIGRAIAVALADAGRPIAVNYRSRADGAKETLALIESHGGEGMCIQADVGDSAEVDRCFQAVETEMGPVHVLVNNAGVRADGLALSLSDEAWNHVLRTNLFGTFACSRRALRTMLKARAGRIVNMASVAGIHSSPGQANYSAAKAGVIGFTRTLAREVAHKGITVNAVAPGLVSTDLTASLGDKRFNALAASVPARRAGEPAEVASLVAWLCSDDASYTTGSVFTTDGGLTA